MSRYYNNVSWSMIALIVLLALSLLLPLGIHSAKEMNQEYTCPVYIQEKITISKSSFSGYIITGKLKNRTNETIIIEELQITASGVNGENHYHTEPITLIDIAIDSNETYNICTDELEFYDKYGQIDISAVLDSARITKCVIDGENVELKILDNRNYVRQGENSYGYIFSIIIGTLSLLGVSCIIIKKIKDKYNS